VRAFTVPTGFHLLSEFTAHAGLRLPRAFTASTGFPVLTGFCLLRAFAVTTGLTALIGLTAPTGVTAPTSFYMMNVAPIESSTLMTKEDTTLFEANVHAKPIRPWPMSGTRRRTTTREVWEGKPGKESFVNAEGCRRYRQSISKKGHRHQSQSQSPGYFHSNASKFTSNVSCQGYCALSPSRETPYSRNPPENLR
jgi:hypothetical protein